MNSDPKKISEAFIYLPWFTNPEKEADWEAKRDRLEKEGVIETFKCPDCGDMREGIAKVLPGDIPIESVCLQCAEARREQHTKDMEIAGRSQYFYKKIPPRYSEVRDPQNKNLIDSVCSIIWGGFGTGKTWEAYAICKSMCLDGSVKTFEFVTEIGLLNELKGGFNDGTYNRRIDKFKNTDLLIVDEVGKSNDTEFNKSLLFEILNSRYDWMKQTILICNAETKEDLFEIMPTATLDRFRENIVHMAGKSKRYQNER